MKKQAAELSNITSLLHLLSLLLLPFSCFLVAFVFSNTYLKKEKVSQLPQLVYYYRKIWKSLKHTQNRRSMQQATAFSFFLFACRQLKNVKINFELRFGNSIQDTDIPTKMVKVMQIFFSDFLFSGFNNSITTSIFPSSLKQAIITPVFKKGDKNLKENYRPVSILPNISKIFERFLFKQISNFMEPFFSQQQCRFWKGYCRQY